MARITVISAGHVSNCPRMVKAADALAAAGHVVRVVAGQHLAWAREADRELMARRTWRLVPIEYGHGARRLASGVAQRWARLVAREGGADVAVALAVNRVYLDLLRAAVREPADLVYGGSAGGLAVAADAGARLACPYAIDLEDAHGLEPLECGDRRGAAWLSAVERRAIRGARLSTTASQAIASYYAATYGIRPLVIENVFEPLDAAPSPASARDPLRVYWFSQTIGPGRGLEDAVDALAAADIAATLHVRGRDEGFTAGLRARAGRGTAIEVSPPGPPDEMVALAAGHHVGLSLERNDIPHRALCLPNKLFVYLAAGLAVAATDTPGQRPVLDTLGQAAAVVPSGDPTALAAAFRAWDADRARLTAARQQAWDAARTRWRWTHPEERGALLGAVEALVR